MIDEKDRRETWVGSDVEEACEAWVEAEILEALKDGRAMTARMLSCRLNVEEKIVSSVLNKLSVENLIRGSRSICRPPRGYDSTLWQLKR